MAYLGNKPVNNFVSFAKQDITGNGGTSYSLDYPVTGANDIELFINNVRQEPTEAYSCSGSTLTLTEAVSSSDDVYVIFRGRALQTVGHPSDSALEAASANIDNGTFVVDAANNRVGIGNSAPASTLHIGTGYSTLQMGADDSTGFHWAKDTTALNLYTGANGAGTKRLGIDTSGRVTTPYQPFSHATLGSNTTTTSDSVIAFDTAVVNRGNHFNTSNYRFTVPTAGDYLVLVGMRRNSQNTGSYTRFTIKKNGSLTAVGLKIQDPIYVASHNTYTNASQDTILTLQANDYLEVYDYSGTYSNVYAANECHFMVRLLG